MGGKRFAVLLCAEDPEYVKKKYGGYFGVFLRLLGEEGEVWDGYRCTRSEFPVDDEIDMYDGFVITGSCNDAHGDDPWIQDLLSLVRKLDLKKKKILGVCFGHQILGRAIGGKIGRAGAGWSIGVTSIGMSSSSKFFTSLKMPATLPIIKIHQDEVWELPAEAEVMAWSEDTKVEMFKYGDHMLGIQGHPEYTKDIVENIIGRLLKNNVFGDSVAKKGRRSLEEGDPDREAWRKLCISFLKGSWASYAIEQDTSEKCR